MSDKVSILGLGHCGCKIASRFISYPNCNVFFINTNASNLDAQQLLLKPQKTAEEYEASINDKQIKTFLKTVDNEVVFILGGGGKISGASLRILASIKQKDITILYIRPDTEFLSGVAKLQEKMTFGIFQEYARSGLFKDIVLIDTPTLSRALQGLTIINRYDKINEAVETNYGLIKMMQESEPVLSNFSQGFNSARLTTLGVVDFATGEEKLFYPLDNMVEKCYYYGIPMKMLETDTNLDQKIKQQVRENKGYVEKAFYGVYSIEQDEPVVGVVAKSGEVQE